MNTLLWMIISTFDLDEPVSEYGFSTRLARENNWTIDFTRKAILEYKKFMYLAATSGQMVSPSPLVDVVWHQHLIFTDSYAALCSLMGKTIQHIPSTHNRNEAARFKQAAGLTKELYRSEFGEQPKEIWANETMQDGLGLPRAGMNIRTFSNRSVLFFVLLVVPFYFLLKPLYLRIDNPYFLYGYILLTVFVLLILYIYNKTILERIVDPIDESAYIRHLMPSELVYLKTGSVEDVVHGSVDQLLKEKKLVVHKDLSFQLADGTRAATAEGLTICETIRTGKVTYPILLRQLIHKPVFTNIAGSMDAFREHFIQSKAFMQLYHVNICIVSFLLMLGVVRFFTGVMRDKPVMFIFIITVLVSVVIAIFIRNLSKLVCTGTIPDLYRTRILSADGYAPGLDWRYFLTGTEVLSPEFVPVIHRLNGNDQSAAGFASSDGSSGGGGSSCGSGCGGGGGCGGGCGGCGGGD